MQITSKSTSASASLPWDGPRARLHRTYTPRGGLGASRAAQASSSPARADNGATRRPQPCSGRGEGPQAGPRHTSLTFVHWLRSAASPIASPSPTPGFGWEATCAWGKPNHHHLPQDKLTHRKPQFSSTCSSSIHSAGNKVFRSFSLQRPCFLSHYLPHRQPSLQQKQDFFFLFVTFVVPFLFGWLSFLGFGSFSKGQGSKGR